MSKGRNKKGNSQPAPKASPVNPHIDDEPNKHEDDPIRVIQDTFDDELQWCVKKLACGMERKEANEKNRQEALKVMTILTSQSAPLVKKRALMRSTFGDYRKKMTQERSTHEKEFKKSLNMSQAVEPQTSSFLKKVCKPNNNQTEHIEFRFDFEDDV